MSNDLSPRAYRALAGLDKLARDADPRWRAANVLAAQLQRGEDVLTAVDALLGYSTAEGANDTVYTAPEITSVWSSFGHRFISDGEGTESCLVCGALYQLQPRADDPTAGDYIAANGDDPMECSRDTGMAHGYPGERHDGNADHDCNCLLCDS